ncbi:ABC transporter permease [Methylobacterium nodulans]|uniref:Binding-protein-dependent transport systems inner membrane component n=1 Tax=Methylobacterium nodulans (strain LMG 21967 / CNCM I-2342 / ORS 2060) TaxID=460265 RepID=B8IW04_METNO|nr:ABC transporter permease subunit [Methylobacterium nodulans]ACL62594.1 binding-protein-dependent transport systems inner membrane component [Methylobacterium nodulans ORS 2060]
MISLPLLRRLERVLPQTVLTAFVVLFFVFLLAPIVFVVLVSFSDAAFVQFPVQSYSLRWYYRLLEYTPFLTSLLFSLKLAVLAALAAALLGVPAALVLARSGTATADAVSTFLLSPISIPMILLGVALLFNLSSLGLGISFTSLLIGHTVVSLPYVVRTVVAVYRGIGREYEEGAAILGASRWQIFRYITLPLISSGIFSGMLFSILISLDNLSLSLFFTSAQTNTLPVVMLSYLQNQFDPAIAAIGTVQMLIAFLALLLIDRTVGLKHMSST